MDKYCPECGQKLSLNPMSQMQAVYLCTSPTCKYPRNGIFTIVNIHYTTEKFKKPDADNIVNKVLDNWKTSPTCELATDNLPQVEVKPIKSESSKNHIGKDIGKILDNLKSNVTPELTMDILSKLLREKIPIEVVDEQNRPIDIEKMLSDYEKKPTEVVQKIVHGRNLESSPTPELTMNLPSKPLCEKTSIEVKDSTEVADDIVPVSWKPGTKANINVKKKVNITIKIPDKNKYKKKNPYENKLKEIKEKIRNIFVNKPKVLCANKSKPKVENKVLADYENKPTQVVENNKVLDNDINKILDSPELSLTPELTINLPSAPLCEKTPIEVKDSTETDDDDIVLVSWKPGPTANINVEKKGKVINIPIKIPDKNKYTKMSGYETKLKEVKKRLHHFLINNPKINNSLCDNINKSKEVEYNVPDNDIDKILDNPESSLTPELTIDVLPKPLCEKIPIEAVESKTHHNDIDKILDSPESSLTPELTMDSLAKPLCEKIPLEVVEKQTYDNDIDKILDSQESSVTPELTIDSLSKPLCEKILIDVKDSIEVDDDDDIEIVSWESGTTANVEKKTLDHTNKPKEVEYNVPDNDIKEKILINVKDSIEVDDDDDIEIVSWEPGTTANLEKKTLDHTNKPKEVEYNVPDNDIKEKTLINVKDSIEVDDDDDIEIVNWEPGTTANVEKKTLNHTNKPKEVEYNVPDNDINKILDNPEPSPTPELTMDLLISKPLCEKVPIEVVVHDNDIDKILGSPGSYITPELKMDLLPKPLCEKIPLEVVESKTHHNNIDKILDSPESSLTPELTMDSLSKPLVCEKMAIEVVENKDNDIDEILDILKLNLAPELTMDLLFKGLCEKIPIDVKDSIEVDDDDDIEIVSWEPGTTVNVEKKILSYTNKPNEVEYNVPDNDIVKIRDSQESSITPESTMDSLSKPLCEKIPLEVIESKTHHNDIDKILDSPESSLAPELTIDVLPKPLCEKIPIEVVESKTHHNDIDKILDSPESSLAPELTTDSLSKPLVCEKMPIEVVENKVYNNDVDMLLDILKLNLTPELTMDLLFKRLCEKIPLEVVENQTHDNDIDKILDSQESSVTPELIMDSLSKPLCEKIPIDVKDSMEVDDDDDIEFDIYKFLDSPMSYLTPELEMDLLSQPLFENISMEVQDSIEVEDDDDIDILSWEPGTTVNVQKKTLNYTNKPNEVEYNVPDNDIDKILDNPEPSPTPELTTDLLISKPLCENIPIEVEVHDNDINKFLDSPESYLTPELEMDLLSHPLFENISMEVQDSIEVEDDDDIEIVSWEPGTTANAEKKKHTNKTNKWNGCINKNIKYNKVRAKKNKLKDVKKKIHRNTGKPKKVEKKERNNDINKILNSPESSLTHELTMDLPSKPSCEKIPIGVEDSIEVDYENKPTEVVEQKADKWKGFKYSSITIKPPKKF